MKFSYRPALAAVILMSPAFLMAPPAAAQSTNTTLYLTDTSTTPHTECQFSTAAITVDGATPSKVSASGTFGPSCNIGGSSGDTSQPVVTLNASSTSINSGESVNIGWTTQHASFCQVSSTIPTGALPNTWTGKFACMGMGDCASEPAQSVILTSGGSLTLTCYNPEAPALSNSASDTVSIDVTGGGGTTPPGCTTPAGMTRLTHATISLPQLNIYGQSFAVSHWKDLFGYNGGGGGYAWPHPWGRKVGLKMRANEYIALAFTPTAEDMAMFNSSTNEPWTGFISWDSGATPGVSWDVSISPCPGDFDSVNGNALDQCYATYPTMSSNLLRIGVISGFTPPNPLLCPVNYNQTYYVNIRAHRDNFGNSQCVGSGKCSINFTVSGAGY